MTPHGFGRRWDGRAKASRTGRPIGTLTRSTGSGRSSMTSSSSTAHLKVDSISPPEMKASAGEESLRPFRLFSGAPGIRARRGSVPEAGRRRDGTTVELTNWSSRSPRARGTQRQGHSTRYPQSLARATARSPQGAASRRVPIVSRHLSWILAARFWNRLWISGGDRVSHRLVALHPSSE